MPTTLTPQLSNEYEHLFDTCIINETKFAAVDTIVNAIVASRARYEAVGQPLNIPWYFIGIIHNMEASLNFKTHLHNGDPLTKRTVNVPAGRPKTGNPPFTWEVSAADALTMKGLNTWTNWSIGGILFQFERYNGFGYRPRGINSPYLWSFSNQYIRGKFVKDGVFDPNAVSKQCGAAVLLRRMRERQIITDLPLDRVAQIRALGTKVKFAPTKFSADAEQLQALLNSVGASLRVDGKAGEKTSDAYKSVTGKRLQGDPRG